jgi:hypothetical protein
MRSRALLSGQKKEEEEEKEKKKEKKKKKRVIVNMFPSPHAQELLILLLELLRKYHFSRTCIKSLRDAEAKHYSHAKEESRLVKSIRKPNPVVYRNCSARNLQLTEKTLANYFLLSKQRTFRCSRLFEIIRTV